MRVEFNAGKKEKKKCIYYFKRFTNGEIKVIVNNKEVYRNNVIIVKPCLKYAHPKIDIKVGDKEENKIEIICKPKRIGQTPQMSLILEIKVDGKKVN